MGVNMSFIGLKFLKQTDKQNQPCNSAKFNNFPVC